MKKLNLIGILLMILLVNSSFAQGFLHVSGKNIVDGNNQNFIIRSIGTGNWMVQEGYMMQSSDVAGTQHEFRAKLIETVGETKTEEFYDAWLANHFTKADVDSMASWGFNSIRVAMHYEWFTPSIQNEPVSGQITWLDKGFNMIDDLLSWCKANQMYLILDLHAAPGGQGKDAAISDYNPALPSLWESDLNKTKTIKLWQKLAERYANETWIGGYDLINEINWTFPEGNNSKVRSLYGLITTAIRGVDQNHVIFVEGNWFANDFSGLTPAWDGNMAYSFHKYWSYNDENALDWIINLRNSTNRPVWLGESGENSNTWFTNLVALAEKNNIGWSWWPVKKSGINNVMFVETPQEYTDLINSWKPGATPMSADATFNAVMAYAENHKIENCEMRYDVIDALIRQPQTTETKAFKSHATSETIYCVDYDLGRNNFAYFDTDTANYHLNTNTFVNWNTGWSYRNDGVDIETCSDMQTNGYSVGWTNPSEWLQYTINSEQAAAYEFTIRSASAENCTFHLEVDGKVASNPLTIASSGGWSTWKTTSFNGIILPQGKTKVRIVFDSGKANLNYFSFSNPQEASGVTFEIFSVKTANFDNELYINVNKEITSTIENINTSDFYLIVNGSVTAISEIVLPSDNNQQLIIKTDKDLFYSDEIKMMYHGTTVLNESQNLKSGDLFVAENNFLKHYEITSKIEAENFYVNSGFEMEDCTDAGGGNNTAYANNGDYLDYIVYVPQSGIYNLDFRVSTPNSNTALDIKMLNNGVFETIGSKTFTQTGGWQNWQTQSAEISLTKGKHILRLYSKSGEYNLNWFMSNFLSTSIDEDITSSEIKLYPNPSSTYVKIHFNSFNEKQIKLYNLSGKELFSETTSNESYTMDVEKYPTGIYIVKVITKAHSQTVKLQIK